MNFFCRGVKESMSLVNWEDSAEETLSELISYKLPPQQIWGDREPPVRAMVACRFERVRSGLWDQKFTLQSRGRSGLPSA